MGSSGYGSDCGGVIIMVVGVASAMGRKQAGEIGGDGCMRKGQESEQGKGVLAIVAVIAVVRGGVTSMEDKRR